MIQVPAAHARISALVTRLQLPVRVPRLRNGERYTVAALMLVFFYLNLGKVRSILQLKKFLAKHGCTSNNPQPRHLGMQHGFRFLVRNCVHPQLQRPLKPGQYCLLTLDSAHPSAACHHRVRDSALTVVRFRRLCGRFGGRCAVCGSKEGEPHFKNALLRTTLEMGHADPRRPLTVRNCIPMCRLCNCAYKDKATFNSRGIITSFLSLDGSSRPARRHAMPLLTQR